jgi:hypothetical protein
MIGLALGRWVSCRKMEPAEDGEIYTGQLLQIYCGCQRHRDRIFFSKNIFVLLFYISAFYTFLLKLFIFLMTPSRTPISDQKTLRAEKLR